MTSVNQATSAAPMMGTEAAAALDTSKLPSRLAGVLERAAQMIGDRIADLMQQISTSSSGTEGAQLQQEVDRLQGALDQFSEKLHDLSNMMGPEMNALGSAVGELRGAIAESYSNFGTSEVDAGTFAETSSVEQEPVRVGGFFGALVERFAGPMMDRIEAMVDKFRDDLRTPATTEGVPEAADVSSAASTGAVADTPAAAESGGGATGEVDAENPAEMMALYNQDPQAFYEQLKDLPAEERSMMMHMVQNEMQQINQMFTMMSQLSQAMHDTQKAIINNLRV